MFQLNYQACPTHQMADTMSPQLSIIVPTYCESENLAELVARIDAATQSANISTEIIIVDDNSPDATTMICKELCKQYPLRLIVRTEERGLSSAVIRGMQEATGTILLCMDADLSHPPEKIPEMYQALQQPENDFVIGSRYVPGGTTAGDWGFFRWLNSVGATLLARPFTTAKDPMAGFFAIHRETFQQSITKLNPVGYKIGLELIVKCQCSNVAEIPIHFADRQHGESKLSLKEQLNYVRHLYRLAHHQYPGIMQLMLFLCVGCTGLLVDLSSYALLLTVAIPAVARMAAIWIAMSWNFWLNRKITFAESQKTPLIKQYIAFCGSCLVGAGLNWSVSIGLSKSIPYFSSHQLTAALLGAVSGTVFNFLLCKLLVFRKQKEDASIPVNPAKTIELNSANRSAPVIEKESREEVAAEQRKKKCINNWTEVLMAHTK